MCSVKYNLSTFNNDHDDREKKTYNFKNILNNELGCSHKGKFSSLHLTDFEAF